MSSNRKKAFELITGEVMVGEIFTPDEDDNLVKLVKGKVSDYTDNPMPSGIWIKREKHITWLAHAEIKSVRDANIFDKEIIYRD